MNCCYPNCRITPQWTPVVEMPTLRTIGVHKPKLSPLVMDAQLMARAGLSQRKAIQQFETLKVEYKTLSGKMVETNKPTYLIMVPVCSKHRDTYNLFNWVRRSEWELIREAARSKGLELKPAALTVVQFKPIGWLPDQEHPEYMLLNRDRMAKDE